MTKDLKYDNYLKVYQITDTTKSGMEINREIMTRKSEKFSGDSVCGIIEDPDTEIFYFVKQYRAGAIEEKDPYLIEVVAGTLENGENPEECFRRECMEEVGFECKDVEYIGSFFPSPGASTEKVHMYYATGKRIENGGGLESESEDIEVIETNYTMEDIIPHISDMKTAYLINFYTLQLLKSDG